MAMLGELLAAARRGDMLDTWFGAASPELAAQVRDAAAACGESTADYLRIAVAAFTRDAAPDDWSQLVSALQRTPDPALAGIGLMVRWRLSRDAPPTSCTEDSVHG